MRKWLINLPGCIVTIAEVEKLCSSALQRALVQVVVKGFENTDIGSYKVS